MTANEKAQELFIKFYTVELYNGRHLDKEAAKECILIAIDEILQAIIETESYLNSAVPTPEQKYWQEVKNEINNL